MRPGPMQGGTTRCLLMSQWAAASIVARSSAAALAAAGKDRRLLLHQARREKGRDVVCPFSGGSCPLSDCGGANGETNECPVAERLQKPRKPTVSIPMPGRVGARRATARSAGTTTRQTGRLSQHDPLTAKDSPDSSLESLLSNGKSPGHDRGLQGLSRDGDQSGTVDWLGSSPICVPSACMSPSSLTAAVTISSPTCSRRSVALRCTRWASRSMSL